MEKMNAMSLDLTKLNIEKLKELFPDVVTEGKIDFDVLRAVLGDEVDDNKEKYQFTWKGKNAAIKLAQTPSSATLRPDKESSKEWDITENLYIEGDNLEVLKLLQKTYYGKIDMIYIDPPYNTGGDLIYMDNYRKNIKTYSELSNQQMSSNPSSNGRFHTDWLNMIYPRLMLARNLLKDSGMIVISIDDNEVSNLKWICDELYGAENFVSLITIKVKAPSGVASGAQMIFDSSEYALIYAKNRTLLQYNHIKEDVEIVDGSTKTANAYNYVLNRINFNNLELIKKFDDDCLYKINKEDYQIVNLTDKSSLSYYNNINKIFRVAALSGGREKIIKEYLDKIEGSLDELYVYEHIPTKGKNAGKKVKDLIFKRGGVLYLKDFVRVDDNTKSVVKQQHITNIINNDWWQGIANEGGIQFKNGKKPLKYIELLLSLIPNKEGIFLDFFSGSATLGQAVYNLNVNDNGHRKFILVQIPEIIDDINYPTICHLGKQRLKNAINNIYSEANLLTEGKKIGFKTFKLDSTNILPWDNETKMIEGDLFSLSDVFKKDRSKEDILYEIMLKYGVFDMPATEVEVNGKTMYRVGKRYMIVCLENEITSEDVKAIAELHPKTVVFKELGFKNDNDKINAEYNLEKAGVEDIKCI